VIRQANFSIVDQGLEIGLRSLGVLIRNKGGAVVAGLSVSIVEPKISRESIIERYLQPLQEAAEEITATLPD
jgi:IclR family pca regulon transcriptional regulator